MDQNTWVCEICELPGPQCECDNYLINDYIPQGEDTLVPPTFSFYPPPYIDQTSYEQNFPSLYESYQYPYYSNSYPIYNQNFGSYLEIPQNQNRINSPRGGGTAHQGEGGVTSPRGGGGTAQQGEGGVTSPRGGGTAHRGEGGIISPRGGGGGGTAHRGDGGVVSPRGVGRGGGLTSPRNSNRTDQKIVCEFYRNGTCTRVKCNFSHVLPEPAEKVPVEKKTRDNTPTGRTD